MPSCVWRCVQGIRDICRRANITAVYVTHDQEEALSMADSIAVMRDGRLMQVGPPRELYTRPGSRFVAEFLGEANFIPGTVASVTGGVASVDTAVGAIRSTVFPDSLKQGVEVTLSLRPEALRLHAAADAQAANTFTARRHETIYLGEIARHLLHITPAGGEGPPVAITASELNPAPPGSADEPVRVGVDPGDVVMLAG